MSGIMNYYGLRKMPRQYSEETLRRLQERASNYRHSPEVRQRMSQSRRKYSPSIVLHTYRENAYNGMHTDKALGQCRGYTSRYLHRLYRSNPDLKRQLQMERAQHEESVV